MRLLFSLLLPLFGTSKELHKLPRIHCPQLKLQGNSVLDLGTARSPLSHYISNVLRMKTGHLIRVFNSEEGEFLCRLLSVRRGEGVQAEVVERVRLVEEEIRLDFTLYFSPIKTKRMKLLVEKTTEIGVDVLQPVITQNTNEVLTTSDMRSLEATIVEAAEQSERLSIPRLMEPISFPAFVERASGLAGAETALVCLERSCSTPLLKALSELHQRRPRPRVGVFVGPEGGFTSEEISSLLEKGGDNLRAVSLGSNVLRAETAALYVLSCWSAICSANCEE